MFDLFDRPEAVLASTWLEAPVGLAGWDTEGRYLRVNPALAALNGVPVEQHLGRRPSEVMGSFGRAVEEQVARVAATGEPIVELPLERTLPDGEVQYRQSSYFPVRSDDGVVRAVGGVVRDISREHAAEAEHRAALRAAVEARALAEAAQVRAETATLAAETARLRTQFLADAGRRMAQSMDLDATLQEVAQLAVPELADWCALYLLAPDGSPKVAAIAHRDPQRTASAIEMACRFPPRRDAARGVAAVIRTRTVELIEHITDEMLEAAAHDEEHLALLRECGFRASLIVPLMTSTRVLGALVLVSAESGRSFEPPELQLAEALAALAGAHIRNAQHYMERAHVAQALQASLLPRSLPVVPGLDVAARYLAAGDRNDVGGDFYDVFAGPDGCWWAVVGDVSGKGPEAAAVTSLTRHTLRTAVALGVEPVQALEILNQALLDDESGRFCTVVVLRLAPRGDTVDVDLVNGGHPPPLVLRRDGTLEQPQAPGTLVGILRDPSFAVRRLQLEPGDTMLLYTDGVVELRPAGVLEGERLLLEAAARGAGLGARELVEHVERHALALHGGHPADDIALVALTCSRHTAHDESRTG